MSNNENDGFNTHGETREELYDRKNNSDLNNNYQEPQPQPNYNQQPNYDRPHKKHLGRWIGGIIIVIFLFLGIGVYHEFNELNNLQRNQDTMLDSVIKNQAIQMAKDKANDNEKPKIIKIIKSVPLSNLQQAANDQARFNQLANQYQISQAEIQKIDQEWFNAQNAQLRYDVAHGNLIAAYPAIQKYLNNKN